MAVPPVDRFSFRRVCGAFPTGVTVVTCRAPDGEMHGMTANSFLSVSLDPLLMLVSIARQATMAQVLEASSSFAVSILAEGQADISNHFAGRSPGLAGTPLTTVAAAPEAEVVSGAAAWMVLDKTTVVDAGDHRLFLGAPTVIETSLSAPLVFHGGRYHELREGFDAHLLAFL